MGNEADEDEDEKSKLATVIQHGSMGNSLSVDTTTEQLKEFQQTLPSKMAASNILTEATLISSICDPKEMELLDALTKKEQVIPSAQETKCILTTQKRNDIYKDKFANQLNFKTTV